MPRIAYRSYRDQEFPARHSCRQFTLFGLVLVAALTCDVSLAAVPAPLSPSVHIFSDPSQPITPLEIAEDSSGYLWLAAEQGVFRFDGRHFVRIAGQAVHPFTIATLSGGAVLVGADNGLFQYRNGSLEQLAAYRTPLIVALASDVLLVEHYPVDHRDIIQYEAVIQAGGKLAFIHQELELAASMWASRDGTLWKRYGNSLKFVRYGADLRAALQRGDLISYHAAHAVAGVERVGVGDFFALPGPDGWLYQRNDSVVTAQKPGLREKSFRIGTFTRDGYWRPYLFGDREGRMWAPGDDLWVAEAGEFRKFRRHELLDKQVMCVFEDSHGVIWFGLDQGGLAALGTEPAIESWNTPSILGPITSIVRLNSTTLLAASDKGALLRKRGPEPWVRITNEDTATPVNQLATGPAGSILGLFRFGPPAMLSPTGKVLRELPLPAEVRDSSARRLVRVSDGSYLIGCSWRVGLLRISHEQITPVPLPDGNPAMVQDIVLGANGVPIVTYQGGLCQFADGVCRPFLTPADGLLTSNPRFIATPRDGEIWVSYVDVKGITRLRLRNDHWEALHVIAKNAGSEPVTDLLRSDRRHWIWRGTAEGLFVCDGVHTEPSDWILLTEPNGLPIRAVARFGFLEDADGTVWIGTASGIAHVQPSSEWFSSPPSPAISQITFGEASFVDATHFPGSFTSPGALTVQFRNTLLLPVRFRLLPIDTRWRTSWTAGARWNKLDPGHYRLEATTGRNPAVAQYAFDVTDTAARNRRIAALFAGFVIAGLAFQAARRIREHRRRRMAPLPEIGPWRDAALSDEHHHLTGLTLDSRYQVGDVLARGGFATILMAQDLSEGNRPCAIKVFHPGALDDEWVAKRFRQEVSALEQLEHPNVVRICGDGVAPDGEPYLVMEYIEGQTLRAALQEGALAPARVASLLRQAGSALDAIHARGIFHRDIKPENIMLRAGAAPGAELVIIDFSIALVKDRDKTIHELSRVGGTLDYMAPEQHQGCAEPASDIYSLAKVVVEMLTGLQVHKLLPSAGMNLPQQARHLLAQSSFGLSPSSLDLMRAALEFHPASRPKSAGSFAEPIAADLEQASRDIVP
jgi:ligand-binding sensor domain-containing protein